MGKNWKTIYTGLDISFAAIFYYSAIKSAATSMWAMPYALIGLLWTVVAIPDVKELALELKRGE